jgi:BirA family transcriptional regulator, biotin operon repressor / biotin---[acetyl-CoA-carboxylase] ligase
MDGSQAFDSALFMRELKAGRFGRPFDYHSSCPSTQDIARAAAQTGAAEGLVVFADEQTAGRGRQGRGWVSPAGVNLYFTLVLRPTLEGLRGLSQSVPLAVADGLESGSLEARVKWPNDVQVGGKKIAGVLIDAELDGQAVSYALVGVGVNVNLSITSDISIAPIATSVLEASGAPTSREKLLARLLERLEFRYEQLATDREAVHQDWKAKLIGLGEEVTVHLPDGSMATGIAEGVREDGALMLRVADGSVLQLAAGELRFPDPHAGHQRA